MAVRPWWESSASACSSLHWVVLATFSTVFPGWKTFKAGWHRTLPICHISLLRFHKRGQGLLQGHLEESLCRVVKKVAFTFTLPINLPGGKSGTLLCVEVLPNQPVDIEGDGSHCSHLPYHPYSVQVRHSCHPLVKNIPIEEGKAIHMTTVVTKSLWGLRYCLWCSSSSHHPCQWPDRPCWRHMFLHLAFSSSSSTIPKTHVQGSLCGPFSPHSPSLHCPWNRCNLKSRIQLTLKMN